MYLNRKKFWISVLISGAIALYGAFWTFLCTFSVLLIATGQVGKEETVSSDMLVVVGLFLFVALVFGRKTWSLIKTYQISACLAQDKDGLIEMETVAGDVHMKQTRFVRLFIKAIGQNQLKNCSIYAIDPTYILLDNGKKTIKERFRVTKCACCGATNVIRMGFDNSCKYCGGKM